MKAISFYLTSNSADLCTVSYDAKLVPSTNKVELLTVCYFYVCSLLLQ